MALACILRHLLIVLVRDVPVWFSSLASLPGWHNRFHVTLHWSQVAAIAVAGSDAPSASRRDQCSNTAVRNHMSDTTATPPNGKAGS